MPEEISACYLSEKHWFPSFDGRTILAEIILPDGRVITGKGPEPSGGFRRGQAYTFRGRWKEYVNKKWGMREEQFHWQSLCLAKPSGRHGVIAYLQSGPGIGEKTAEQIYDTWGENCLDVLKNGQLDSVLKSVPLLRTGLKRVKATPEDLRRHFVSREEDEKIDIDLHNLLDGERLPGSIHRKAKEEWGIAAAEIIKANPYRLMRFRGVGFKRCDRLYLNWGGKPDAIRRQALCAWYGIEQEHQSSGDTWIDYKFAASSVRDNIGGCEPNIPKAIKLCLRHGSLDALRTDRSGKIDWDGDQLWLSDSRKSYHEKSVARYVAEALQEDPLIAGWQMDAGSLSEHQQQKMHDLMNAGGCLRILGGGPGTGKTFCVAHLVKQLCGIVGQDQIALAAPTGKAAVRLTEALGEYGVEMHARTWHSTLGVTTSSGGDGWGFRYGRRDPLPFSVVIGDEMSMQDAYMCSCSMAARGKGTLFLLVGDVNQLPPVGHGAPLRDMIRAGVPYQELTEVRRNSGAIVHACKVIREESRLEIQDGGNLELLETRDGHLQLLTPTIEEVCDELRLDRIWDMQVVTALNESGKLSRKILNRALQNQLNSHPEIKGTPFRIGDKVCCTKNMWAIEATHGIEGLEKVEGLGTSEDAVRNDNGMIYVANGDIGKVIHCESHRMVVRVLAPTRCVLVGRSMKKQKDQEEHADEDAVNKEEETTSTGCDWDLAYALSVHKSQGSEFPVVIVMADSSGGARRLCDRSWFYTAISRAKKRCIVIGERYTVDCMLRTNKIEERKTFLVEHIQQKRLEVAKQVAKGGA